LAVCSVPAPCSGAALGAPRRGSVSQPPSSTAVISQAQLRSRQSMTSRLYRLDVENVPNHPAQRSIENVCRAYSGSGKLNQEQLRKKRKGLWIAVGASRGA
jgi:hypothetical protein